MPTLAEVRNNLTVTTGASGDTTAALSNPLQNELLARVRSYVAAGESDHNICVELDVKPSELTTLKKRVFEQEATDVNSRTTVDTFVEYKLKMDRICDDLDGIHEGAAGARQYTAAMGALKAKAQIIDKVIDRGQELGLINRAAKKHEVLGGVAVAHLDDTQLLDKMKEIHRKTTSFITEYGEHSIGNLPVPPIYQGE